MRVLVLVMAALLAASQVQGVEPQEDGPRDAVLQGAPGGDAEPKSGCAYRGRPQKYTAAPPMPHPSHSGTSLRPEPALIPAQVAPTTSRLSPTWRRPCAMAQVSPLAAPPPAWALPRYAYGRSRSEGF